MSKLGGKYEMNSNTILIWCKLVFVLQKNWVHLLHVTLYVFSPNHTPEITKLYNLSSISSTVSFSAY